VHGDRDTKVPPFWHGAQYGVVVSTVVVVVGTVVVVVVVPAPVYVLHLIIFK